MMDNYNGNNIKYLEAQKRVKQLKGFYIHATVYVLVNLFLIANTVQEGRSLLDLNTYWTAIIWGVGLLAHGANVFLPNMLMGKDWEEKKIRELMDKNK